MIKINQIKLPVTHSDEALKKKIIKMLKLNAKTGFTYRILKKSLDARKKPELFYTYSVAVEIEDTKNSEEAIVKRAASSSVLIYKEKEYMIPACGHIPLDRRPVIAGAGPAGLFCAYILAEAGFRPIIIERGSRVEKRTCDVQKFWESGILNPKSNVQFGEGGAGTFSDGKLNTSVKDPSGRNRLVLETFVRFGADPSILYDNKPHIGTDVLSEVIVNMREFLVDKGATFIFDTCVSNLDIVSNKLLSVYTDSDNNSQIKTDVCVLALGHSARDTFDMLYNKGFDMECKSFAVGFRVEHPQRMIDESQYGIQKKIILPPSPYKVTSNFPNGRGVYSFCMCPGVYFNLSFWYKLIDKTIWGAYFSGIGCLVLIAINVIFVPIYGYIACAWAGFAGYGTAMVLSYIVGQKKYPIDYPVKDIMIYVVLAIVLFAGMTQVNKYLSPIMALAANTVLILIFTAYLVKKDFPLSSLPVVGKYFRK